MTKSTINKKYIKCCVCNHTYVKKYISMHYRTKHKDFDYCKYISRSMTFNSHNNNNIIFLQNYEIYCSYCHKKIKKCNKIRHDNSLAHKIYSTLKTNQKNKILLFKISKEIKNENYKLDICLDKSLNKFPKQNEIDFYDANDGNHISYDIEKNINDLSNNKNNKQNDIFEKSIFSDNNGISNESIIDGNNKIYGLIINDNNINDINNNKNDMSVSQSNSGSTSSYHIETESFMSLSKAQINNNYDDFEVSQKQREEIELIIQKIEKKKKFKEELKKWRDRTRKKTKNNSS